MPASANITSSAKLTGTTGYVQVALAATEHVWVRVMTDGKTAFEGMFAPGQSLKWEAKEILVVETGNGAGLNGSFNGKPVGAFGPRGQLVARAWTPAGETAVPPKPTAATRHADSVTRPPLPSVAVSYRLITESLDY